MDELKMRTEVAHSLAKYRNHLEFVGYKIDEEDEDFLLAVHPRKTNLSLRKISERGVLVSTLYGVKSATKRSSLLEFLNGLNSEFLFMKTYLTDSGYVRIETFYEGEYDKTNFSILLENIEFDINTFFESDLIDTFIE